MTTDSQPLDVEVIRRALVVATASVERQPDSIRAQLLERLSDPSLVTVAVMPSEGDAMRLRLYVGPDQLIDLDLRAVGLHFVGDELVLLDVNDDDLERLPVWE